MGSSPSSLVNQTQSPHFGYLRLNFDTTQRIARGQYSENRALATAEKVAKYSLGGLVAIVIFEAIKNGVKLLANTALFLGNLGYKAYDTYWNQRNVAALSQQEPVPASVAAMDPVVATIQDLQDRAMAEPSAPAATSLASVAEPVQEPVAVLVREEPVFSAPISSASVPEPVQEPALTAPAVYPTVVVNGNEPDQHEPALPVSADAAPSQVVASDAVKTDQADVADVEDVADDDLSDEEEIDEPTVSVPPALTAQPQAAARTWMNKETVAKTAKYAAPRVALSAAAAVATYSAYQYGPAALLAARALVGF